MSIDDTPGDDVLPDAHKFATPVLEEPVYNKVYVKFVSLCFNGSSQMSYGNDGVRAHSVELLRLGCFYFEFSDAIREGDSGRVLRCWKYALLMFFASGNRNYAYEAAKFLIQHWYTLSLRLSAQLLWSPFISVHSLPRQKHCW